MQQRYYDPMAGRFLSVDPIVTDADTGYAFNRFVYRILAMAASISLGILVLASCSTSPIFDNGDYIGGAPPGADVQKERARGR
jgi:hypothetical protein